MNRRSFLRSLAVVAAPYVITTAGVLMPVVKIITGIHRNNVSVFTGGIIPEGLISHYGWWYGTQWSDDDIQKLREQGRPALKFNKIRSEHS